MIDRTEQDRILMANAVIEDLKQFEKLRKIEPLLSVDELSHRMAWPKKDIKWLLKKMKDERK